MAKNNRWTTTTIKALTMGPMIFLDKNTMVIPMFSWREGKKNDSFVLELRVVYQALGKQGISFYKGFGHAIVSAILT